ncbi:MAG: CoA transferase [Bacteriodetes bacterium]|nr:CoA transferase [Bacteroidota bacterium]
MFKNLVVIELSSVLAGPMVGMFFAELGARVIKIENKKTGGDVTRTWKLKNEQSGDVSAYFASANFGKESIALDIALPNDYNLLCTIVAKADIVLSNYQPKVARKLKVDYHTLSLFNPTLLYGQITGYGMDDNRAGYDAVIQAESGFMSMNGTPGTEPTKMPVALMDILAAHQLKEGLLVAMIERLQNGKGKFVHVSLLDSAIASLANQATNYLQNKHCPQQTGSHHPNIAPYGTLFTTRDEHTIIFAVGTDAQFQSLCTILNAPELAADVRFTTNQQRVVNRTELIQLLQNKVSNINSTELLQLCYQHKVPVGKVQTVQEALESPESQSMILATNGFKAPKTTAFATDSENISPPPQYNQHELAIRAEFKTS